MTAEAAVARLILGLLDSVLNKDKEGVLVSNGRKTSRKLWLLVTFLIEEARTHHGIAS